MTIYHADAEWRASRIHDGGRAWNLKIAPCPACGRSHRIGAGVSRAPVLVGRLHELECGAGPVSIGHRANQPARKVARKAEERLDEAAELLLELGDVLELPHARSSVRRLSRVVAKVQRRTAFIRELQEPRKPQEGNDD